MPIRRLSLRLAKFALIPISLVLIWWGFILTREKNDPAYNISQGNIRIVDYYLCDEEQEQISALTQEVQITLKVSKTSAIALCGKLVAVDPPIPLIFALRRANQQLAVAGVSDYFEEGPFHIVLVTHTDDEFIPGKYTLVVVYNHITLIEQEIILE